MQKKQGSKPKICFPARLFTCLISEEFAQRILGIGHGCLEFRLNDIPNQSSMVGILWMSLSVKMSSSSKEGEENSEITDSVSVENQ